MTVTTAARTAAELRDDLFMVCNDKKAGEGSSRGSDRVVDRQG